MPAALRCFVAALCLPAIAVACTPPQARSTATGPAPGKSVATGESPGKPSGPVAIRFVGDVAAARAGVPVPVTVELQSAMAVDAVNVEIVGLDGLEVVGGMQRLALGAFTAAVPQRQSLSVVPTAAGGLLRVTVTSRVGGDSQTSVAALAVGPGGGAVQAKPVVTMTPDGERLISLPAQEDSTPR